MRVDYVFLNPGTDTGPIQDALDADGEHVPSLVACLFENIAVVAAHEYFLVTRKPQLVMGHADVGTKNLGGNVHGAVRAQTGSARGSRCGGRSGGHMKQPWPWDACCFSGLLDRHPNPKDDHPPPGRHGAALSRAASAAGWDQLGKRTDDPEDASARAWPVKRPIDYFRMFYGDTALFGPAHAVECGLEFFGAEHG